jgi:Mlc titration factor MtfA (ptsG expression regulator)
MFKRFRNWRENKRIKKLGFTTEQWQAAIADWPMMKRYQGAERDALRKVTFRFLVRKSIIAGDGFQFTNDMCLKSLLWHVRLFCTLA